MDDIETKLELMQEEIDLLGDCVKSLANTINTLLEVTQSLKDYLAPDVQIPDNVVYLKPKDKK